MPELPEVETTCRGVAPWVTGARVVRVAVHEPRLRWPVPDSLTAALTGQIISQVSRRAKYLLLHTAAGVLLLHLGMSGRLRVVPADTPKGKHDHLDLTLDTGQLLRLNDPRRFGCALWLTEPPAQHPLLRDLGPEPLSDEFNPDGLWQQARGRNAPIKRFIMDGRNVVGVGNIYASESLYRAGIRPQRAAGKVTKAESVRLVTAVRQVLGAAIEAGGTTLRDYVGVDGNTGYFQQALRVYGRDGQPCLSCGTAIRQQVIGQRASYWCPSCQR